jgi:hypothetical protein
MNATLFVSLLLTSVISIAVAEEITLDINTDKLQNFKDVKGQIAVPYLLVFRTRD